MGDAAAGRELAVALAAHEAELVGVDDARIEPVPGADIGEPAVVVIAVCEVFGPVPAVLLPCIGEGRQRGGKRDDGGEKEGLKICFHG